MDKQRFKTSVLLELLRNRIYSAVAAAGDNAHNEKEKWLDLIRVTINKLIENDSDKDARIKSLEGALRNILNASENLPIDVLVPHIRVQVRNALKEE